MTPERALAEAEKWLGMADASFTRRQEDSRTAVQIARGYLALSYALRPTRRSRRRPYLDADEQTFYGQEPL